MENKIEQIDTSGKILAQIAYKFRLYPTLEQEKKLQNTLNSCCFTYNWALERLNKQERPNRFEIQKEFTQFKKDNSDLQEVYAKALFMEIYKLFSALRTLASLKRNHKRVGKLKFRTRDRFNTFTYHQSGWKLSENENKYGILHLSKIGDIKARLHRKIEGRQKMVTISRNNGNWFVSISCDREIQPVKRNNIRKIGLDLGISHFIVDSDGHYFDYPFYLKQAQQRLRRKQKALSRKKKGSKNRTKARQELARLFEKINGQRKDFADKLSRYYINNYSVICVENLDKRYLIEHSWRNLRKLMIDVAWDRFLRCLDYKTETAGVQVIKVNPKNTTQMCSQCGKIVKKDLSVRIHKCSFCGLEIDRDYNSSLNILRIGQGLSECKPVEKRPLVRLYSNLAKPSQRSRKAERQSPTLKVAFCRTPRKNTPLEIDDKKLAKVL